jgi:SAM-dependent methyltransferase
MSHSQADSLHLTVPAWRPPAWVPAALLLAGALALFAIRSVHGIHFLTFGDESGHFLGARAIHAGDRLYRDFIDAHGPLVFMVAHTFGVLFGWHEPLDARWAMVGLATVAGAGVATSSALNGLAPRLWAAALFFGLIAAPWLVQALNMVNYHLLGGVCVTITVAWLVIPAWTGARVARYRAFLCGLCLALLCANAYSLAPSALLLAGSAAISLRYGSIRPHRYPVLLYCLLGFLAGSAAVLVWLLRYGDVIGYLVFHIIDNQVNYARYSGYGLRIMLASVIPSLAPASLVQTLASILCAAGFLLLFIARSPGWLKRPMLRTLAFGAMLGAVLMLNVRGAAGFQNGSFVVASMAVFALALPMMLAGQAVPSWPRAWIATACMGALLCGVELTCRRAVNSPWGAARQDYVKWPKSSLAIDVQQPIFRRIRQVLRPDERLLVLVYNPDFFLPAGYLPIRKFHDYLPWEADYARAPWFNRPRDLCADLAKNPPPVIVYDHWVVWGRWNPEDFIPCLAPLLRQRYVADANPTLYIRRDRLPQP